VLSVVHAEAPFPPLPYLKFDAAEVTDTVAFYLCGPRYGAWAALIHFAGLVIRGSDPFSASMKLAAVLSMFAGMLLAKSLAGQVAWGSLARAAAMTVANYVYLYVLFPQFLSYAARMVSWMGGVAALFILTAVFNIVHAVLTISVARWIAVEVENRLGRLS